MVSPPPPEMAVRLIVPELARVSALPPVVTLPPRVSVWRPRWPMSVPPIAIGELIVALVLAAIDVLGVFRSMAPPVSV